MTNSRPPEGMPTPAEFLGYFVGMFFAFMVPVSVACIFGQNKEILASHRILGFVGVLFFILICGVFGITIVILVNRRQHRREAGIAMSFRQDFYGLLRRLNP